MSAHLILWHKSNNSFKPEGHYNTEEFNQSSLIKWITVNNYSFSPIPKRKGKTRRNSSLLRTHHQDFRATKNYEITLQSHMIHLWGRVITTEEKSTKTIFHCQIYIKKGYVCSFSTKLHAIFKYICIKISQKFDLVMIFLHNLFIEVELQMEGNYIFNCALWQYNVTLEAKKCSLFICHAHVPNK